ncbi:hypothetical protein DPMN_150500 [Dreissena polymorpha]|uniref:Uncharacterized protein n=1 Tax=Dreissena polymorpha TaxID=45954 RepID=A0A9D4J619_DREPO|nr:hypothetical protein DPMN_150500 [Dreissena polymorpha]
MFAGTIGGNCSCKSKLVPTGMSLESYYKVGVLGRTPGPVIMQAYARMDLKHFEIHSIYYTTFPITSAVLTHCHRDLARWNHAQITVIVHADEKESTVGLCLRQKSREM